jgi:hypothetical protein
LIIRSIALFCCSIIAIVAIPSSIKATISIVDLLIRYDVCLAAQTAHQPWPDTAFPGNIPQPAHSSSLSPAKSAQLLQY